MDISTNELKDQYGVVEQTSYLYPWDEKFDHWSEQFRLFEENPTEKLKEWDQNYLQVFH
jgi:hypothetical protein